MTTRPRLRPDTLLHIYYFEGVIPANLQLANENYLGNWVEEGFSFLFFTGPAEQDVAEILDSHPNVQLLDRYQMTYGDWQGGAIEPVRLGRFLINPPWIKASAGPEEISMTIDSGVVFGNGHHPTTRTCLTAMEIACSGGRVKTMLDLGCGTGILAVAAAGLGCEKILAVDFNFLAAQTARANVEANQLSDRIAVIHGRAEEHLSHPTDLLVANIHYAVMKELVLHPGFLQQKWFILSGLMNSEAEKIVDQLRRLPVLILKQWREDGSWNTILGITRPT